MTNSRVFVAGLALLAGSCSIHPLPSGLPRASTPEIVRNIRCEAREAVINALNNRPDGVSDQRTTVNHKLLKQAAIAYEFTLDTTQAETASLDLGLTDPFSNGVLGIGMNASNARSRVNSRNFRVVDEFDTLIGPRMANYCSAATQTTSWQYPITGRIGLGEVVETFFQLNGDATLQDAKSFAPVFSDKLVFETTIDASVTPSVLFSPVGHNIANRIRLGSASGSLSANRKDLHTVVVAMSLPVPPAGGKTAAKPGKAAQKSGGATILMSPYVFPMADAPVSAKSGDAKDRALLELDRQEYRAFGLRLQR